MLNKFKKQEKATIPIYMQKFYEKRRMKRGAKNPPIPKGFRHLKEEDQNIFTIINEDDGSKFLWIPIGRMPANASQDGYNCNKKYGRRDFAIENDVEWQLNWFYDDMPSKYINIIEKAGGYYVSCFLASWYKNNIVFKPGRDVLFVGHQKIEKLCKSYVNGMKGVYGMQMTGASYDGMIRFIEMQTNESPENWGITKRGKTGSSPSLYGIHDLARFGEFTSETNAGAFIIRGDGKTPVSRTLKEWKNCNKSAFRICLYVEPEEEKYDNQVKLLSDKLMRVYKESGAKL